LLIDASGDSEWREQACERERERWDGLVGLNHFGPDGTIGLVGGLRGIVVTSNSYSTCKKIHAHIKLGKLNKNITQ
jgi:hypothetical protein